MSQDDPYLHDLLKARRARRLSPGPIVALAIVVILLGALMLKLSGQQEPEPMATAQPRALGVEYASALVQHSVEAAQLPLRVAAAPDEDAEDAPSSPAAAPGAPLPSEPLPSWEDGKAVSLSGVLAKNESISAALQRRHVASRHVHLAVSAMAKVFNFRTSRPGDQWTVDVDERGQITRLRYQTSPEDIWETTRHAEDYVTEKVKVPLERRVEVASGHVEASLWDSLTGAGLTKAQAATYLELFTHIIDFGAETQPGDRFSMVFEEIYLEGQKLRSGRILAAAYEGSGGLRQAFALLDDEEGQRPEYFDEHGNSLRHTFLKSPLTTARVTSRFGMRFHPVLKRKKMHNGVDYGAPTGTPIMAVADGVVVSAGWEGANGKLVVLKHANGMTTHYAHLSYIPRALKRGKEVRQRDIIGHVGSTGRSTGPHLHYGVKQQGRWIDPLTMTSTRAPGLKGKGRQSYLTEVVAPLQRRLGVEGKQLKVRGTFTPAQAHAQRPQEDTPFEDF